MSVVQPDNTATLFEDLASMFFAMLWDYREAVGLGLVVIGVPGLLTGQMHLPVPAFVLLVALVVIPLVAFGRVPVLLPSFRAGRARHDRRLFVRDWPRLCDRLGWSEVLARHAVGVRDDGRPKPAQVPDLLGYGVDGAVSWLEIRPLASQHREKWSAMADALARAEGFPSYRRSEPRPGVLRIELLGQVLPVTAAYRPELHDRDAWDEIVVAVDGFGQPVIWKPSEVPHLLVAGVTQGGKGSGLKRILHHTLRTGWQPLVFNPKRSGEYGWCEFLGVPVIDDVPLAKQVAEWLLAEMERRQGIVKSFRVNNWRDLPDPSIMSPLVIIVDEAFALLSPNKANKEYQAMQLVVGDVLTRIATQGRAVGLHVVVTTQRPSIDSLGPAGGALRMNLDASIGVASLDSEGARMVFGKLDDPDVLRVLDGTKGRAIAKGLVPGSVEEVPVQLLYISEQELNANPPRVKVPQLVTGELPVFSSLRLIDGEAAA